MPMPHDDMFDSIFQTGSLNIGRLYRINAWGLWDNEGQLRIFKTEMDARSFCIKQKYGEDDV